ncbi:MAG TPA: hypothetical protein VED01_25180 [Burkholderiales bacterium]|nr:hypothetical protein [Burkholderiales bacterium]
MGFVIPAKAGIQILFCLAFCAPVAAAQFSFAAFGDVPYTEAEEPQLISMIAEMNREPLAFSLHVGDFKSAHSECSDALYAQRREWFMLSHHPFVFVPGDNEWIDCRRARWAPREPLERLAKLREMFYGGDGNLGQRPLGIQSQRSRGYPEHLRWTIADIVFATLNVPGPSNNRGMPKESKARTAALTEWMRETFRLAREKKLPAVVIALQANLWPPRAAYAEILSTLSAEALRYEGEVLVIHGDTHWHRVDQPLVDPRSGAPVTNVTRLEVFGSPFVNWVHVTVRTENGRARFTFVPGSDLGAQRAR